MADKVFLIGAGSMAEAFIRGIIEQHAVQAENILVMNRSNRHRVNRLQEDYGIQIASSVEDIRAVRLVVLAVKPMDAADALRPFLPFLRGQVLLSFCAGLSIGWLESYTENRVPVIRTMPNLPVAVLAGATAMAASPRIADDDLAFVRHLLMQVGAVVDLDESLMDAATAFSGSGPGFVCYFLEAMEKAAMHLGIEEHTARMLLLDTVVGTAKVLQEWGLSPEELRRRVTSPNGTTHAGVTVFEQGRMQALVEKALVAAADRSEEMGRLLTGARIDGRD